MNKCVVVCILLFLISNAMASESALLDKSAASYEEKKLQANESLASKKSSLESAYKKATISLARQTIVELEKVKLAETKKGNLEQALAAKEQIEALKKAIAENTSEPHKPAVPTNKFARIYSQLNFLKLSDGSKIWSNRPYKIVELPKSLHGLYCSRINAGSKKAQKLSILTNGVVYLMNIGSEDNKLGSYLTKKGWEYQIDLDAHYDDDNRSKVTMFTKVFKKGDTVIIPAYGDYSILKKK